MGAKPVTPEQREELNRLYSEGYTLKQVAASVGLAIPTVSKYLTPENRVLAANRISSQCRIDDHGRECTQCRDYQPWGEYTSSKNNGPHDKQSKCKACTWLNVSVVCLCGQHRKHKKSVACAACITDHARAVGTINTHGYRDVWMPEHPNAFPSGYVLEHVKIMSDMLGRPLIKGENVHHKNGVRDDNAPDNLELWNTSQPPGQRVSDKIAFVIDLSTLYPEELAAQGFMLVPSTANLDRSPILRQEVTTR